MDTGYELPLAWEKRGRGAGGVVGGLYGWWLTLRKLAVLQPQILNQDLDQIQYVIERLEKVEAPVEVGLLLFQREGRKGLGGAGGGAPSRCD